MNPLTREEYDDIRRNTQRYRYDGKCDNCYFHKIDSYGDCVCVNENSIYYLNKTDYEFYCRDYMEK